MAILNIYDSLLSGKIYRASFSHENAIEILKLMDKKYHLDESIVNDFVNMFDSQATQVK